MASHAEEKPSAPAKSATTYAPSSRHLTHSDAARKERKGFPALPQRGCCRFPSFIVAGWMQRIVDVSLKRPLQAEDFGDLPEFYHPENIAKVFDDVYTARAAEGKHGVLGALFQIFKGRMAVAVFLLFISQACTLAAPLFIREIVFFLVESNIDGQESPDLYEGILYAVGLILVIGIGGLCRAHSNFQGAFLGIGVRNALLSLVYRSSLRLSPAALSKATPGQLITLMTTDVQKFRDLFFPIIQLLMGPFTIITAVGFLLDIVGPAVLLGMLIMIIFLPLTAFFGKKLFVAQFAKLAQSDKRTNLTSEILQGMSVVKSYGWEESFLKKIIDIRMDEAKFLKSTLYLQAAILPISLAVPAIAITITFVLRVAFDGGLPSASRSFAALGFFNSLIIPFTLVPLGLANLAQAISSTRRIDKFLQSDVLPIIPRTPRAPKGETAAHLGPTDIVWDKEEGSDVVLRDINIDVPSGAFWAVVGQVGSGKTTLLASLLSETVATGNSASKAVLRGSVAYVSQTAYIKNATVKSNILFGLPLDQERLDYAVEMAALTPDLKVLPAGIETEIGEKGVNCSGGQKQRISLARAVYADADVYLFDDPLSAVDAHVGAHIFNKIMCEALEGKTRILVTNQIQFLSSQAVNHILVLSSGRIEERGTYRDLSRDGPKFRALLDAQQSTANQQDEASSDSDSEYSAPTIGPAPTAGGASGASATADGAADEASDTTELAEIDLSSTPAPTASPKPKPKLIATPSGRLIEDETVKLGGVEYRTYWYYFKHMTSYFGLFVLLILFAVTQPLRAIGNQIFGEYATEDTYTNKEFVRYYTLSMCGYLVFSVARSLYWASLSVTTANHVHNQVISTLVRCPMKFFETTPTGRILNRLGKDQNEMDIRLPFLTQFLWDMGFGIITTLAVIAIASPWFLIAVPFLFAIYMRIRSIYQVVAVQLQRIESVSLSPIFSLYSETLNGTGTIRAFDRTQFFKDSFLHRVGFSDRSLLVIFGSMLYLRIRVQSVSILLISITALLVVFTRHSVDISYSGIGLTYAVSILPTLEFFVQFSADVAAKMNAMERLLEYTELPVEPPSVLEGDKALIERNWPQAGKIEFQDVDMRYRHDLPLVLKKLNLSITAGEKIGICGRTGSGKSSLFVTLLRLVDASAGQISIDDVPTTHIGLTTLRQRLAIIPQNPVMFSGTIRSNLDPFDDKSDEEIWEALELCHMAEAVRGSAPTAAAGAANQNAATDTNATKAGAEPEVVATNAAPSKAQITRSGLTTPVEDGGSNFSVGERQLLCMGRALLRGARVLLLDEASASVDPETDALLQTTIRTQFRDCTVLTIAHRISTILDSDRVVVMDDGVVAEYDAPGSLLRDSDSIFAGLVRESVEQERRMNRRRTSSATSPLVTALADAVHSPKA